MAQRRRENQFSAALGAVSSLTCCGEMVTARDLHLAVSWVMRDEAVVIAILCVSACFSATGPASVTFTKDVAPVLQKNCQGCHRPGEAASFSMLTYEQARPWAKAMKEAVRL